MNRYFHILITIALIAVSGCSAEYDGLLPESNVVSCNVDDKQLELVQAIERYMAGQSDFAHLSRHPDTENGFPLGLRFSDGHIGIIRVGGSGFNLVKSGYNRSSTNAGISDRIDDHYHEIIIITDSICS